MARSHPPSLLRSAERLIRDERLFGAGDVVLCACSGGPDSTAMLHALALLRPRLGHVVVAHGVDHGLRGEAAAELALARNVARDLGVPFSTTELTVGRGSNLQARARAARIEALGIAALRVGARAIATGHTADDRAETFLIRLLRGAGPRGLAVLPPRAPLPFPVQVSCLEGKSSPILVRPLLAARRRDILAHLERHHLSYATDPSNADRHYTRVRIRRDVLPLLEEISPRVVDHLVILADILAGEVPSSGMDGLGRAQQMAIARALRLGRSRLRLRLPAGQDVEVTFPGGRIALNEPK